MFSTAADKDLLFPPDHTNICAAAENKRKLVSNQAAKQLHSCQVIYLPKSDLYLLSV